MKHTFTPTTKRQSVMAERMYTLRGLMAGKTFTVHRTDRRGMTHTEKWHVDSWSSPDCPPFAEPAHCWVLCSAEYQGRQVTYHHHNIDNDTQVLPDCVMLCKRAGFDISNEKQYDEVHRQIRLGGPLRREE